MYDPCVGNFLNDNSCCSCCNGSTPCDCYPCRPCAKREEKFSNMIMPSFLRNRIKSSKDKPGLSRKKQMTKSAKSPAPSANNEEENEMSGNDITNTIDGAMPQSTGNAIGPSPNSYPHMLEANPAVMQGPAGGCLGMGDPTNQLPCINQAYGAVHQQPTSAIPAAGLPSKQCPPFDPCTGRDVQLQAQSAPQQGQPPALFSYFYPIFQHLPNPASNPCGPAACAPTQATPDDTSAKEKNRVNKPNTNSQAKASKQPGPQVKVNQPNNRTKANSRKELQVINCSDAGPDLIERICKSLQVPRQPEGGFILLPMTMSSKAKKSEESGKQTNKQANAKGDISKKKTPIQSTSNDSNVDPQKDSSKPTRNCGCNTLISGNIQDKSQGRQSENNDENNNNCCGPSCNSGCNPGCNSGCNPVCSSGCNPGCNPGCNSGCNPSCNPGCNSGCCCWPRYSYCYNPCTGCYYWYNNRCCCGGNACCNSQCNRCPNSCPMPAQVQSPKTNSKPDVPKPKPPPAKTTKVKTPGENNNRVMAGAVAPFQPEVQELYERWMGFNQYAANNANGFPPMPATPNPLNSIPIYYQMAQFPYPPMQQQDLGSFETPNQDMSKQKQATSINWSPL